jgi:serine/threonine protein kinase
MSLQLVVIAGPDKGRPFPLQPGPDLRLGRSDKAHYRLPADMRVSRVHAHILLEGERVTIRDQGIIHRNVTPENILRDATSKASKLGDLMLPKALEGNSGRTTLSGARRPGELLGDVEYMSPERMLGETEIDARSDLYGLGATVYSLLTGKPPFEGNDLHGRIARIRQEAGRPLPDRAGDAEGPGAGRQAQRRDGVRKRESNSPRTSYTGCATRIYTARTRKAKRPIKGFLSSLFFSACLGRVNP